MSITFVNPILYLCRCYYQHCNLLVINILNVHYFFSTSHPQSRTRPGADRSAAAIRADISWYLVLKLGGECDRKSLSADQIVGRCIICQVKCCNDQTCKPCLTMFRMTIFGLLIATYFSTVHSTVFYNKMWYNWLSWLITCIRFHCRAP